MFTITVGRIGKGGTKTGTLAARELVIGRDAESDLVLEDRSVSRLHCRLVAIEGAAIVMDAGSRNGTRLNGEPVVHPTLLTEEDELVIGPYVLTVRSLVGRGTAGPARPRRERPRRGVATEREVSRSEVCWAVLGLNPGTSFEEARATWRKLVAQYHPDKVAHLGPELRALAERKVREFNEAWEQIAPRCAA